MTTAISQILAQPSDHRVRLLLPFFLKRNALAEAEQALLQCVHETGNTRHCWEKPATTPLLYRDETLSSVYSFLFGQDNGCCSYFRVPDETANFWFKNGGFFTKLAEAEQPNTAGRSTRFDVSPATPGIELFLSPHGAGVLSVTFTPKHSDDSRYLQELNYRLSQVREFTAYPFRLPHSAQSPNPIPSADAPLKERLGYAGGAFTLMEWAGFLLQPLVALHYRPMQQQFSVYSVTRFDVSSDFSNDDACIVLRPYLAAVAHVEEYHHAGSLEVNEQVLNPRHWAAVGSLGAAHLVADQNQPPRDFDEQRLAVALHKYFIPYLLSLMQRIALQAIIEEARDILISDCTDVPNPTACRVEHLRKLNRHTLTFTVNGWFTEISSREVINQYYALAQQGLRVQDSFQTVQRALHNAEAMDNDRFQSGTLSKIGEMAEQVNRSAGIVAHVQSKVEWLEVFFVSYYATALVHYIKSSEFLDDDYVHVSLLLAPVVTGLIAFWKLRPDLLNKHGEQQPQTTSEYDTHHEATGNSGRRSLMFIILVFGIWLAIGIGLRHYNGDCQELSQTTETSDSSAVPKQTPTTTTAEIIRSHS